MSFESQINAMDAVINGGEDVPADIQIHGAGGGEAPEAGPPTPDALSHLDPNTNPQYGTDANTPPPAQPQNQPGQNQPIQPAQQPAPLTPDEVIAQQLQQSAQPLPQQTSVPQNQPQGGSRASTRMRKLANKLKEARIANLQLQQQVQQPPPVFQQPVYPPPVEQNAEGADPAPVAPQPGQPIPPAQQPQQPLPQQPVYYPPPPQQPVPQQQAQSQVTEADIEAEVMMEVYQAAYNDEILPQGTRYYKDFQQRVGGLLNSPQTAMVGLEVMHPDNQIENQAHLLYALAANPDQVTRLAQMSPGARLVELGGISRSISRLASGQNQPQVPTTALPVNNGVTPKAVPAPQQPDSDWGFDKSDDQILGDNFFGDGKPV